LNAIPEGKWKEEDRFVFVALLTAHPDSGIIGKPCKEKGLGIHP
jgi:hypothetical protein